MTAEVVISFVAAGFLVHLGLAYRGRLRAFRRRALERPAPLETYPFLSVVRPVKGADVEQLDNFRASLRTGYPGRLETIFVFEDDKDPGHSAAVQAIAEYRSEGGTDAARIVFAGKPPEGRTGKINNMIVGRSYAGGEYIAFGDSDGRPDCHVLTNLVEHLVQDETAGAAFAPATTPSAPRTAGDVGHHLLLNAFLVANMELRAGAGRELPFIMGQLMVFRASALDAIGGVRCADGQLVDDMYLGARILDAGYRNIIGTRALHIINYGLSFADFMRLWRRWLFFGRGGIPLSFTLPLVVRAIGYYASIALAVAALVLGAWWAVIAPAILFLLEGLHYIRLHRMLGGAPIPLRYLWMVWVPYISVIPVGISMLVNPTLRWRGHTYRVDNTAQLRRQYAPGSDDSDLPAAAD